MDHVTQTAQAVSQTVSLELVDAEGDVTTLEADFCYQPSDPFAVTATFKTGGGPVCWTFGRELLVHGTYEPTGDGDVHVWPCLGADGAAVVIIELSSPEGQVLVQASSRDMAQLVTAMLASVPLGDEAAFVDIDRELAGLFAV
ncbi:MAG TPA: SsgA family sporulation/cell division regulator [Marmoricola sp.]|nr:SsgA family sporulation/cell division regulator [Marmoricola sp.]